MATSEASSRPAKKIEEKKTSMKMVVLGDNGPLVSELCLGTMTWGSQTTDEKKIFAMLDRFVAAGGNFIDTAEMYPVPCKAHWCGATENILGRWFAANPGMRENIVIATKVCGPSKRSFVVANRTDPPSDEGTFTNESRGDIFAACAGSLRRLGTTYLDILYVHWPSRPAPCFGKSLYRAWMKGRHQSLGEPYTAVAFEETILAMKALIDEGKIRHWAISNETSFGVCSIVAECNRLGCPKPVCIQNDFSLTDRRFCTELAETCAPWNHNISGVPYGILAGGTLSGKYLEGKRPSMGRHVWKDKYQKGWQSRYIFPRVLTACAKYAKVAELAEISPAVLAAAWAKQCFFNKSIIIGANNMEQLNGMISACDVTLSQATLEAIDKIHFEDQNPQIVF